jgi:putative endonuclease
MTAARSARGQAARRSGRRGEVLVALLLMARGYRILGFRLAAPQGEIDILALKGGVLAVVEVKRRSTLETALEAVHAEQRERLRRSAMAIVAGRPALKAATIRLDLVALAPGRLRDGT